MPTVPRYGGRQVAPQALPAARRQAGPTELSEGVGLARAREQTGQTITGVAGAVGELAHTLGSETLRARDEARERALDVSQWDSDNRLTEARQRLLNDPDTGAYTVKGKAAAGLHDSVTADFETQASEIRADLTTDRQREKFDQLHARHRAALYAALDPYVLKEADVYETQTVISLVNNKHHEAVSAAGDDVQVSAALSAAERAVTASAARRGWSPEQTEEAIATLRTQTHVGVVEALLAQQRPDKAQSYYDAAKDQINGEQRTGLEKALDRGSTDQQAQVAAAKILAAGGTPAEQRAAAKREPSKIQDSVVARIEHEQAVQDKETRDADEAVTRRAYATVFQTKSLDSLDPVTKEKIAAHLPALSRWATELARGVPTETDLKTYYATMQQATTDPSGFATRNLLPLMATLDEGDFKRLVDLQANIRTGKRGQADEALAGFRTRNDLVDQTLFQYTQTKEKDYTAQQQDAKANLLRLMDVWTEAEQADGRKVTNAQTQEHLDHLLSQSATVPGSLWAIWSPRRYDLADRQKRLLDFTIDDVSPADRKELEASLRANRRPVTPQTVLDLYLRIHTSGAP